MEKPAADGASREELLALVAARDVELAARDATLASALAERDSLRRRLELPNVRAALLGEGLLDVLGLVAAVGYAADVSHCRELCRLTRNVVQRGDVADMLEQSLRLQCGAREARAAEREDFVFARGLVADDDDEQGGEVTILGTTQLIRAALLNNLPRVRQLIQLGLPLDLVKESTGMSALLWASFAGHEHVVKALLDGKYEGKGADIEKRDQMGWTSLMNACLFSHEAVVRLLLSRGANVAMRDASGRTALYWHTLNVTIKALLKAHGAVSDGDDDDEEDEDDVEEDAEDAEGAEDAGGDGA